MFKKIDTHIHADFSSDSLIKMSELVEKAIQLNYIYICFTEHFDLLPQELVKYGLLPLTKYENKINQLRNQYPQINIGFGLEIGEPHRSEQLRNDLLNNIHIDYMIGSIHLLPNGLNLSTPINFELTNNHLESYYQEIYKMIQYSQFDTVGHIGIYKREYKSNLKNFESIINDYLHEIFKLMIKKDICLEINNSGFRSDINSFLPEAKEIKNYISLGGKLITIGSDSHRIESFDKYFNITIDTLKNIGLNEVYYKDDKKWKSLNI